MKEFNIIKYTQKRILAFMLSFILGLLAILLGGPLFQTPGSLLLQNDSNTSNIFNKNAKYEVISVVDGDTIKIQNGSEIETVRLIGVDTPETVHPSKPVECYGKEASNFLKNLLENTQVYIELDNSQNERDTYGRLLAYVYLPDKTLVNQLIIAQGYGFEYTYKVPYKFQREFKQAQEVAREEERGLWGAKCNE